MSRSVDATAGIIPGRSSSVKVDVKDRSPRTAALLTKYTDSDMHNMLAYLETLK